MNDSASDPRCFPDTARDVLAFWFETPPTSHWSTSERARHQEVQKRWFVKSQEFDALCADRFGILVDSALLGEFADWNRCAEATLARILLLDQFPRNVFRGTAKAYAGDALALDIAMRFVAEGSLDKLTPLEQVFALLPLEHAEDIEAQEESVRHFEALGQRDPRLASNVDYAHRHHDVIARFGRFPHRNAILGRQSTAEEIEFLKSPGSSF